MRPTYYVEAIPADLARQYRETFLRWIEAGGNPNFGPGTPGGLCDTPEAAALAADEAEAAGFAVKIHYRWKALRPSRAKLRVAE